MKDTKSMENHARLKKPERHDKWNVTYDSWLDFESNKTTAKSYQRYQWNNWGNLHINYMTN